MTTRSEFERQIRQYTKVQTYTESDYDSFFTGALGDMRRDVRAWELMKVQDIAFAESSATTPAGMVEIEAAAVAVGGGSAPVKVKAFAQLQPILGATGAPAFISLVGPSVYIAPGGGVTVNVQYWAAPPMPPLAPSNSTDVDDADVFTSNHEHLYRQALLVQAYEWSQDNAAVEGAISKYAALVDLVNGASQQSLGGRGSGGGW